MRETFGRSATRSGVRELADIHASHIASLTLHPSSSSTPVTKIASDTAGLNENRAREYMRPTDGILCSRVPKICDTSARQTVSFEAQRPAFSISLALLDYRFPRPSPQRIVLQQRPMDLLRGNHSFVDWDLDSRLWNEPSSGPVRKILKE